MNDRFNTMNVDNNKKTPNSLLTKCVLVHRDCSAHLGFNVNIEGLKESDTFEEDIQQKKLKNCLKRPKDCCRYTRKTKRQCLIWIHALLAIS